MNLEKFGKSGKMEIIIRPQQKQLEILEQVKLPFTDLIKYWKWR